MFGYRIEPNSFRRKKNLFILLQRRDYSVSNGSKRHMMREIVRTICDEIRHVYQHVVPVDLSSTGIELI